MEAGLFLKAWHMFGGIINGNLDDSAQRCFLLPWLLVLHFHNHDYITASPKLMLTTS
jgi:hypothetical protein